MIRAVRRNTELGLILLGAVITVGAYVLASLGRTASLPADLVPFLVVILGLVAAAHVATRRLAPGADGVLLPLAGLLNGIGYVFIARLDPDLAGLQAAWTAFGIVAYVVTLILVRRARDLQRLRYTVALAGLALLLLPLMPGLGRSINGARLWVRVGSVNFQPGEFAKITLAVFLASYLVEKRELLQTYTRTIGRVMLPDLKHFGPILLAWGLSMVIMLAEKDLGSSLLFFALFVALLWVATARVAYVAAGLGLFTAGALFAWSSFAHVQDRVRVWLDPWPYASGPAYQLVQALFAFGTGGLSGTGVSLGSPQQIPAATTDFIFAAVGEELGLLGTAAVLAAYLLMIGAGLRIAMRAEPPFEKLLATGLTVILALQTFVIVGGVTRLVPLTGVTLPFMSYGGSSLVANYVLLALLLRLSDDSARRAEQVAVASDDTRIGEGG
jgi:cell division protein FtsW (lipid II flippase)